MIKINTAQRFRDLNHDRLLENNRGVLDIAEYISEIAFRCKNEGITIYTLSADVINRFSYLISKGYLDASYVTVNYMENGNIIKTASFDNNGQLKGHQVGYFAMPKLESRLQKV